MLLFALLHICGFAYANSLGEMTPSPWKDDMDVGRSIGADQQTPRTTRPTSTRPTSTFITTMTTTQPTTIQEPSRQPPVVTTSTHWSTVYATTTIFVPSHPTTVTATRTYTAPKTVTVTPTGQTTFTTQWSTVYNTTTSTLPWAWRTETIVSYRTILTTLYSKLSMSFFTSQFW